MQRWSLISNLDFSSFTISSLFWQAACFESTFYMIDERDPVEQEKAMTPIIIMIEAAIRSAVLVALMSPQPTVVIVVTVQYRPIVYIVPISYKLQSKVAIQLSVSLYQTAKKIHKHDIVWIKSSEKSAKKNKRSAATLNCILMRFFLFLYFQTFLTILTSRMSLKRRPILAPLINESIFVTIFSSSLSQNKPRKRGRMAKKSIQNQPDKQFLAILHLSVTNFISLSRSSQ